MVAWRIYYDNGSTFDADQGQPWEAPSRGVLVILIGAPEGREIVFKWDWYYWHIQEATWYGADQWGLIDALLENRAIAVKQGRTVNSQTWQEVWKRAKSDPDFIGGVQRRPKPVGSSMSDG